MITGTIKRFLRRLDDLHTLEENRAAQAKRPIAAVQIAFTDRLQRVSGLLKVNRRSLVELDALFASLQHRAFRGELSAMSIGAVA
jgi:hypothetical protein